MRVWAMGPFETAGRTAFDHCNAPVSNESWRNACTCARLVPPALVVVLALGLFTGTPVAQFTSSAARRASLLSAAEFPTYDAAVWRQQVDGLTAKLAASRLAEQPDSPELSELLESRRIADVLRVLRTIVDAHPERMPRAFEIVAAESTQFQDSGHGYQEALQLIVDAAKARLPDLRREDAARVARQLLLLDRPSQTVKQPPFVDLLRSFVQQYSGTETALLTEVDVIALEHPIGARLQALDEFIRAHPGTLAAAKALYQKGFQLSIGNVYPDYEVRGGDPTDRFFRVLDLVTELESGRYPSSEWVDRAPTLVTHFFAGGPSYAPGNIERMLEGYTSFLKTHFELSQLDAARDGIGYIVSFKIADLCARKGERTAGVERVLTELEREIEDVSAVRYLRAAFYISSMNEHAGERLALYHKAIGALRTLAAQGNGHYHRKALATLASLYFSERDYPNARAHFKNTGRVPAHRVGLDCGVAGRSIRGGTGRVAAGSTRVCDRSGGVRVGPHGPRPWALVRCAQLRGAR